jgi:hypothetical protein
MTAVSRRGDRIGGSRAFGRRARRSSVAGAAGGLGRRGSSVEGATGRLGRPGSPGATGGFGRRGSSGVGAPVGWGAEGVDRRSAGVCRRGPGARSPGSAAACPTPPHRRSPAGTSCSSAAYSGTSAQPCARGRILCRLAALERLNVTVVLPGCARLTLSRGGLKVAGRRRRCPRLPLCRPRTPSGTATLRRASTPRVRHTGDREQWRIGPGGGCREPWAGVRANERDGWRQRRDAGGWR